MPELHDQVTALLKQSRAAHDRAKTARSQKQVDLATVELLEARDLRVQAHTADPDHTAPYWWLESPGHDAMMAFYAQKLGAQA